MDKETKEMFNMIIVAMDQMEERMNKRFDEMATKEEMRNMYENLHHEINGVKLNTEALDMRMECVERKVDSLETKVDSLETKVDSLETKVDALDQRLGVVEQKVDSLEKTVASIRLDLQPMQTHEKRIRKLEDEVFRQGKGAGKVVWQP